MSSGWPGALFLILATLLGVMAGGKPARAEDYHPPLLEPLPVSSSFGEFRANHFHGGIDFSTAGRIGIPVYAVADGWVWRARASGSGYGLALYIRLDDGRTQVIAHLDRVASGIDGFIAAAQESLDRYEVDLDPPPGRLAVKRGEMIAWTGESGAGPPHLHFEMREGEDANIGVNPRLLGFGDSDEAAPVIRRLLVTPVGAGSLVGGEPEARSFLATPTTGDRYRLDQRIEVTGIVRLGLEVVDPAPRDNRMAPHRIRLVEGEVNHYDVRLDRFDWNRTHEVECFFDLSEASRGRRFALNCHRPEGTRDPVFGDMPVGAGLLVPPPPPGPGRRRLSLVASDLAGHEAVVDVDMVHRPVTAMLPFGARATGATPGIDLEAAVTVAGLVVRPETSGAWRDPRISLAPPEPGPFAWFDHLIGRVPAAPSAAAPLLPAGARFSAALLAPPLTFEFRPTLLLTVTGPDGAPQLVGADTLDIIGLVRGERRTVRFERLSIDFPDSAVFAPFWLGLATAPGDTASGLVPASMVHRLEAPGMVLDRAARFAMAPTDASVPTMGLYRKGGAGWTWVGNQSGPDGIGGDTRYLGDLMLAIDDAAPVVTVEAPGAGVQDERPSIRASLRETGSGLTPASISATLDGVPQLLVWDPESRTLSGRSRRALTPGTHRLVITAVDRAGNSTIETRDFQLVR